MAEGDVTFYNNLKEQLWLKTMDFDTDTHTAKLMGSGHTLDIDLDDEWGDISADIAVGGTVTDTITNPVVAQDNTNDWATWDFDDIVFTDPDCGTPKTCEIYNDTTATDLLICSIELNATATNGGSYTLQVGTYFARIA